MTDRAKKITELTVLTAPVGGDLLIIEDVSANVTKSVTVSNLSLALNLANTDAQYTFSNTMNFNGLVNLNGTTVAAGIIYQGNTTANTVLGFNPATGLLGSFISQIDNYNYVGVVNTSNGTQASADFALYNDSWNGSADKWVDLGISSSQYSNTGWTVGGPDDAYLYTSNSSLAIGSNNHSVYLFAGGTLAANRKATISSNGVSITSNLTINSVFSAPQTTKASNATGNPGEICWDSGYIYVCTAANTWKRAALSTY